MLRRQMKMGTGVLVLGLLFATAALPLGGCNQKKKQVTAAPNVTLDDLVGDWTIAPGSEYNLAYNWYRGAAESRGKAVVDADLDQLAAQAARYNAQIPLIITFKEDRTLTVIDGKQKFLMIWRIDGSHVYWGNGDPKTETSLDYTDGTLTSDNPKKGYKSFRIVKKTS